MSIFDDISKWLDYDESNDSDNFEEEQEEKEDDLTNYNSFIDTYLHKYGHKLKLKQSCSDSNADVTNKIKSAYWSQNGSLFAYFVGIDVFENAINVSSVEYKGNKLNIVSFRDYLGLGLNDFSPNLGNYAILDNIKGKYVLFVPVVGNDASFIDAIRALTEYYVYIQSKTGKVIKRKFYSDLQTVKYTLAFMPDFKTYKVFSTKNDAINGVSLQNCNNGSNNFYRVISEGLLCYNVKYKNCNNYLEQHVSGKRFNEYKNAIRGKYPESYNAIGNKKLEWEKQHNTSVNKHNDALSKMISKGEKYYKCIDYLYNKYSSLMKGDMLIFDNKIVFCLDHDVLPKYVRKPMRFINLDNGLYYNVYVDSEYGVDTDSGDYNVPDEICSGTIKGIGDACYASEYSIWVETDSENRLYSYCPFSELWV